MIEEIKKEIKKTFYIDEDDMHFEKANINKLAPMGDWELNFDWDYGLIESTEAQFNQLVIGLDKGVIAPEELRAFIKPTETLEEALERVEAINDKNPSIDSLLGE